MSTLCLLNRGWNFGEVEVLGRLRGVPKWEFNCLFSKRSILGILRCEMSREALSTRERRSGNHCWKNNTQVKPGRVSTEDDIFSRSKSTKDNECEGKVQKKEAFFMLAREPSFCRSVCRKVDKKEKGGKRSNWDRFRASPEVDEGGTRRHASGLSRSRLLFKSASVVSCRVLLFLVLRTMVLREEPTSDGCMAGDICSSRAVHCSVRGAVLRGERWVWARQMFAVTRAPVSPLHLGQIGCWNFDRGVGAIVEETFWSCLGKKHVISKTIINCI